MIFLILGKNPALSLAEIINAYPAVFKKVPLDPAKHAAKEFVLLEKDIDIPEAVKKLGGVVKGGKVIREMENFHKEHLQSWLNGYVSALFEEEKVRRKNKFYFGFSFYGGDKGKERIEKDLAMGLKKYLKNEGINSRWVVSKERALSSVIVQKNNLLREKNGIEINFFFKDNKIFIGETLAVQDFVKYSYLDYGRPARDARAGMLPPKLARMIINLANPGKKTTVMDPFCGSGTILQEALLAGYEDIIGADLKKEAISACEKNINWLKRKEKFEGTVRLFNASSEKIASAIKKSSIGTIITEPYLGPPIFPESSIDIDFVISNLRKLYIKSLAQFHKILVPGGIIVMIWPIFKIWDEQKRERYYRFMPILEEVEKIGFRGVSLFPKQITDGVKKIYGRDAISKRTTLIYSRADQNILREIVKFKKN